MASALRPGLVNYLATTYLFGIPMATLTNLELIERLNWRYAVKKFDVDRPISQSNWDTIEQALVLSPSSYGLQPYRFFVIDDASIRHRLAVASYGQSQVDDCAKFVVFAIRKALGHAYVDRLIARIAEVRRVSIESLSSYKSAMIGDLIDGPRHIWIDEWSTRQAYLALGNLLTSAAVIGIDACPMEGFEPEKYNEILGLSQRGFSAVVVCALGYRSAEDRHADDAKVRFTTNDLIEHR